MAETTKTFSVLGSVSQLSGEYSPTVSVKGGPSNQSISAMVYVESKEALLDYAVGQKAVITVTIINEEEE